MAYFDSSFSADSPVLTISPQTAHQAISLGMPPYSAEAVNMDSSMTFPTNHTLPRQPPLVPPPPPPQQQRQQQYQRPNGAGRKRSRDEAEVNLGEDVPAPAPIEPIKESEEDWIYGEGMVLIKPGAGYVADASSQSGTWVEEQALAAEEAHKAELAALQRQQLDRPSLRSHKSQRLEHGVVASPGQDVKCPSPGTSVANTSPIATLSQDGVSQPVIDDFTLHLGIGWRRLSDDEHIQAAARGWARYIENHYPLSDVSIRLESKGLQSYLVEAAEGFFLFAENLRQGRLVSTSVEGVFTNLKCNPPHFEGQNTMEAAETPKPIESQPSETGHHGAAGEGDIEMEVC